MSLMRVEHRAEQGRGCVFEQHRVFNGCGVLGLIG